MKYHLGHCSWAYDIIDGVIGARRHEIYAESLCVPDIEIPPGLLFLGIFQRRATFVTQHTFCVGARPFLSIKAEKYPRTGHFLPFSVLCRCDDEADWIP